jgi:MFS superfamily sulfate permease-like transporter
VPEGIGYASLAGISPMQGIYAGMVPVAVAAATTGSVLMTSTSNAVMTGFVMGGAVLIMVGKADEIVGYDPEGISNKVVKAADILTHPGRWDPTTALVGLATIAAAFALEAIGWPVERLTAHLAASTDRGHRLPFPLTAAEIEALATEVLDVDGRPLANRQGVHHRRRTALAVDR